MSKEKEEPIITFRTYNDPVLAQIERGRLEENDIHCFVDDSAMSIYSVFGNTLSTIKLQIFERDLEKAKAILAEDADLTVDELPKEDAVMVCPYCGSNNVRNSQSVPDDANWLTRIVSTVANALPFEKEKEWHCFNCGKDF